VSIIGGGILLIGLYMTILARPGSVRSQKSIKSIFGVDTSTRYLESSVRFTQIGGAMLVIAGIAVVVIGFTSGRAFG